MQGRDRIDDIVSQWARERPELDVDSLALVGRLIRASTLVNDVLASNLSHYGLQPGWFDLLAALRRAGPPFELSPGRLMEETMLSSPGMTKRLDRMAEAGLVRRRPDPGDRRGVLVGLTPRGLEIVDESLSAHVAREDELLLALSAAERRTLDRLLRKLLATLEASPS